MDDAQDLAACLRITRAEADANTTTESRRALLESKLTNLRYSVLHVAEGLFGLDFAELARRDTECR